MYCNVVGVLFVCLFVCVCLFCLFLLLMVCVCVCVCVCVLCRLKQKLLFSIMYTQHNQYAIIQQINLNIKQILCHCYGLEKVINLIINSVAKKHIYYIYIYICVCVCVCVRARVRVCVLSYLPGAC